MRPIYDAKFHGEISKRMSPPSRQTATKFSRTAGMNCQTRYSWRHSWKREVELVSFPVIQDSGHSGTDLDAYFPKK